MTLEEICNIAKDKSNFITVKDYINFSKLFLNNIKQNTQAEIVSQNENQYRFYQFNESGHFRITRPINYNLLYPKKVFPKASKEFLKILKNIKTIDKSDNTAKEIINRVTYTLQQSIGASLDGLPPGKANTARKLNGDLFESLIKLIINEIGIKCNSGVVKIPVVVDGKEQFKMSYQHDLVIKEDTKIKMIGSVKTTSKDRIDKIFIDKFLYNKLTETTTPHIAIFLNDVQRKKYKAENKFGVSATFLPGHFKGYTVKLNPLDGVYYCDIRPNMKVENILKDHISTFDNLLINDIWKLI